MSNITGSSKNQRHERTRKTSQNVNFSHEKKGQVEVYQNIPTEYSKLEGFSPSALFYRAFFVVERRMIMSTVTEVGHVMLEREFFVSMACHQVCYKN